MDFHLLCYKILNNNEQISLYIKIISSFLGSGKLNNNSDWNYIEHHHFSLS